MSVVGLDIGNDTSCVALARKRGIDVLMNKESKRETPAVVNFGDKMRFIGTDGSAKFSLSPERTVHQLKRILGKKFSNPAVQADIAKLPFSVTEGPDGSCLVNVLFCHELTSFTPEQVMAMIMVDCKHIVEVEAGTTVTDCVISVPAYYDEAERRAMLDAASIAGLNCLRLMNETTATALAYGIYKTDLPDSDSVNVAFVDVGHSSTQVSIVSFKKNGMEIKSHAWDRDLGGRDVDEVLFEHFSVEFMEKFKVDIKSSKKASLKLRTAVEKLKKMLSANAEAPLNIECIMDDKDVRGMMTREQLEALCAPLFSRFKAPIDRALADAKLKPQDISSVEIVGSSTRIPSIAKVVEEAFQRIPSRTLNSKECVSRGCALQCAMLSPVFKVRDFAVKDACPYTVEFFWDRDGEQSSQALFEKNSYFPSTKSLTLLRGKPFKVTAMIRELGTKIGEFEIGPFDVPQNMEKAKLKILIKMNLHGLVNVEGVDNVVEIVEEVQREVSMEDPAAATPSTGDNAAKGTASMDTDAASHAGAEEHSNLEQKVKIKKCSVPYKMTGVPGFNKQKLDEFFEKECQLQAADNLQEETNVKKNALEAYLYSLRNKMYDSLSPYIKESEKDALVCTLQEVEDWLYDEGEDTTKSVYISKLEELKKIGNPIESRYNEDLQRGPAANTLRQAAEAYLAFSKQDSANQPQINVADRQMVAKEAEAVLKWISEKEALQSSQEKWMEPVLLTNDILKKKDTLDRVCKTISTKPVPDGAAPSKAEDAAPATHSTQNDAAPMDVENSEEQQTVQEQAMDEDKQ
ncbi:hypothetical protein CEUSTIGMA_g5818.t1 [Chlamydomonas eustigma]|uniref:Uncharacterized protein n=1 Tax=Chlamydomonas eustigma TaxID=1157962 RepID=A0A250X5Q7_9CHLO|nr:hypothetical protein CEUSTIGMA_g5818.t1 [Chlamydomonas eustigma]|eukprot:GAX78376.1 hypothetical protein CEUSTIGMA_g5818.t1 [Chlamydomonas eustigma]